MKGRLPRIIPLPDEAMAILDRIRPSDPAPRDFVCKGAADGGRINYQAMRLLLRALGLDYDVHRFRTTFKSFCLDNLKHRLASRRTRPRSCNRRQGRRDLPRYQSDRPPPHPERVVEFVSARRGLHGRLRGAGPVVGR
jgi:integrase